jgi:hypothetical protein
MSSSGNYKKLVLDPRSLKPYWQTMDDKIYSDAISALNDAILHPHATYSELVIMTNIKKQVETNRYNE